MGFYDEQIKKLYESCPRLVIFSINSIFDKHHAENAEVIYLNRELQGGAETHAKFMDMLLEIENCKYHLEFQLLEDYMAIRMYEYAVRETVRDVTALVDGRKVSKYELEVKMPQQAVIFLAGANKQAQITVHLTLPDGQEVDYALPCVSAAESVEELIRKKLFLLVPFQQVQLTKKLSALSDDKDANIKSDKQRQEMEWARHQAAEEVIAYRIQVKAGLEKLVSDAIISAEEKEKLYDALRNIERYMVERSHQIDEEVKKVGDEDYISISERDKAEGRAEGRAEGALDMLCGLVRDGLITLSEAAKRAGKTEEEIAQYIQKTSS